MAQTVLAVMQSKKATVTPLPNPRFCVVLLIQRARHNVPINGELCRSLGRSPSPRRKNPLRDFSPVKPSLRSVCTAYATLAEERKNDHHKEKRDKAKP